MMPAVFTVAVARQFFDANAPLGLSCPRVGAFKNDEPSGYRTFLAAEPYYHVATVVIPASGKSASSL
jgi:hypothetical protein